VIEFHDEFVDGATAATDRLCDDSPDVVESFQREGVISSRSRQ
jgi:hypothetical protein